MIMPSLNTYVELLGESNLFYGVCVGLFSVAKLSSMPLMGSEHARIMSFLSFARFFFVFCELSGKEQFQMNALG